MRLETEEVAPGVTKANLIGRLDIAGARAIDLSFNVLAGSKRALVVDLSRVEFIASMGLRTLIMGSHTVRSKQGRMVLLAPPADVQAVLISSGTDSVLPILLDLDEAIRAVTG